MTVTVVPLGTCFDDEYYLIHIGRYGQVVRKNSGWYARACTCNPHDCSTPHQVYERSKKILGGLDELRTFSSMRARPTTEGFSPGDAPEDLVAHCEIDAYITTLNPPKPS